MNKRMMLAALLLVSVTADVSGTDFEERISKKSWYRDYFNEVIYRKDRNIINEKNENFIFFLFIMYCCIYTYCCTRSKD